MDLQAKLAELADLQRQRDEIEVKMAALFRDTSKPTGAKRGRPRKTPNDNDPTHVITDRGFTVENTDPKESKVHSSLTKDPT